MPDIRTITIDIGADFGVYPFGARATDGPASAERFIAEFLAPASEANAKIVLHFDNARGVGPSWLHEAARYVSTEGLDVEIVSKRDPAVPMMFTRSMSSVRADNGRTDPDAHV